MDLPEADLVYVLTRLPLKSIARFKSVCREWKSLLESAFFRDLFLSTSKNSSSTWSLMRRDLRDGGSVHEVLALYGCKRWGLSRSLGTFVSSLETDPKIEIKGIEVVAFTHGLVLLNVRIGDTRKSYYVGNPVLQQWVRVPQPPRLSDDLRLRETWYLTASGLVTHMEDGVVVAYKVVLSPTDIDTHFYFRIYSSETGTWTLKKVNCPCPVYSMTLYDPINLNGNLHWLDIAFADEVVRGAINKTIKTRGIVAHDFYVAGREADQCRVIPFPDVEEDMDDDEQRLRFKRVCTTSGGFLMYISRVIGNGDTVLRVWRLKNYTEDSGEWLMSWEINTEWIGFGLRYVPMAMHPFNTHVLYVWSYQENCIVSCNMRTEEFTLLKGAERGTDDCTLIPKDCRSYMESYYRERRIKDSQYISQFVLPQWLDPVPRPPPSPDLLPDDMHKHNQTEE